MDISKDKLFHFLAGTLSAFIASVFVLLMDLQLTLIPFIGVFVSYLIEILQKEFKTGVPEWLDAVWSVIPFILFYIVLVVR